MDYLAKLGYNLGCKLNEFRIKLGKIVYPEGRTDVINPYYHMGLGVGGGTVYIVGSVLACVPTEVTIIPTIAAVVLLGWLPKVQKGYEQHSLNEWMI